MSIRYVIGDATAPEGDSRKIIVHVCNDVGRWGRGFVVAVSKRWPEPEQAYRAWHCGGREQLFALGEVQFVQVRDDLLVANLIGQHGTVHSGRTPPVRYGAIRRGLRTVAARAKQFGATAHMPRIGCGLAGGEWERVEDIIKTELDAVGVQVIVYDLPPEKES